MITEVMQSELSSKSVLYSRNHYNALTAQRTENNTNSIKLVAHIRCTEENLR